MAHVGLEKNRYTAKKSAVAAVAMFVVLAAVPVLADTAQERVISRLSCETARDRVQSGTPVSLQMRQEPEQGSYQESFIHRVSGETSISVGREHRMGNEATKSGTPALLQVSQELEQSNYRDAYVHRIGGETFPRANGKR